MRFAEVDAVTIDAYGTMLHVRDPVPALALALARQGVSSQPEAVRAAFLAEVRHYRPRSLRGRDEASLAELRRECVGVFLGALAAPLDPAAFVGEFVAALEFELLPGTAEALDALRARGLSLAVVSNWDCALPGILERLGIADRFDAVCVSAIVGAEKPDAAIFAEALRRLGVEPGRAVHVGNDEDDESGARAAGMRFAPAPIATAFRGWS